MTSRVIVLVCGDELRGDDGVALAAVGALAPAALARAEVRIVGVVAVEDLVALPTGSRVVIVDAVAGPPPGQLVELDLAALYGRAAGVAAFDAGAPTAPAPGLAAFDAEAPAAPAQGLAAFDAGGPAAPDAGATPSRAPGVPAARGMAAMSPASSHQLPLPEVVALAGLLRNAPLEGRFVGVGIESVAFGIGLSQSVAAAVPALAQAVARAVRALG